MIINIAWRNIWRSRTRSLIVIGAVMVGVWTFILMAALTFGLSKGYVDNAIRFQTSHLQMHHPQFVEDKEVEYTITDVELSELKAQQEIANVAERVLVQGMIKSSRGARGVTIRGVVPEAEEESDCPRNRTRRKAECRA